MLKVQGVKKDESTLMIALYNESNKFLGKEAFRTLEHPLYGNKQICSIEITDLPTGSYAISIFQDLNGDRQLNTNLFGIPIEPYGFSNNARGSFGPPKFKDARFHLGWGQVKVAVRLR